MNSSDANGLRARKRCHSVQHADSDRRVGRLRTDAARHRRLPVSKSNTADLVLVKRTLVIAAARLPCAPAASRYVSIPPRCASFRRACAQANALPCPFVSGIEGVAPRTAIAVWQCRVLCARSPPILSIGSSTGIGPSSPVNALASSTSCRFTSTTRT
jgi:hypothetical protein